MTSNLWNTAEWYNMFEIMLNAYMTLPLPTGYQRKKMLKSVCILFLLFSILLFIHFLKCWQGEFVYQSNASFVSDHFLYSHDLNVWFRDDIVRTNYMLVTLRGLRVKRIFNRLSCISNYLQTIYKNSCHILVSRNCFILTKYRNR